MFEVGRLCIKTAGRDAGKKCVIVELLDDKFVTIDGETRRRKCNMRHLEPAKDTINIKKGASHADVSAEFKKLGIDLAETKPRKAKERTKQVRAADRKKLAPKPEPKKAKGAAKKEEKSGRKEPEKKASATEKKPETKLEKAISEEKNE